MMFKIAAVYHITLSKIKNLTLSDTGDQHSSPDAMANLIKIGQTVQKYGDLTVFQNWRPSAILDLLGAYWDHTR